MKHPSKNQRRSEKEIWALLSIQEKSGVRVIAFCKTYKIHKATYYNWRNKYGAQIKTIDKFVPVHFGRSESEPTLFGEIELASKAIVCLYQQVDATWIKSLLQ